MVRRKNRRKHKKRASFVTIPLPLTDLMYKPEVEEQMHIQYVALKTGSFFIITKVSAQ